ncbi:MAG: S8 family serine peptidase [Acholeplasmataceae bacterium]|nr:S8 family serine peptidase [Acholeplasmataceae bacterium]
MNISIYLAFVVLLSSLGASAYAQERNLKTELLVYILPDSLELPEKEKGLIPIAQAGKSVASEELQVALASTKARSIGRAFPNWPARDSMVVRSGGSEISAPPFHRFFIVTFDSEQDAERAILTLSSMPSVKFAERHSQPILYNDPSYLDGTQWYLNNDGRLGGVVGADINAETAWAIFTGSSAVKIAIIDSGIELNHDDLAGRASGDSHTGHNHGTLVAGVAAANAMNGEGIRGVDWNAQIISKRVFESDKSWRGDNIAALKITDAIAEGADVLNCSWGGPGIPSTTLRMAFDYAYQMDRVVVAAMGNDHTTLTNYPAGYRNVIAVGATKNNDTRSSFSTMGTHIDIVAPGGVDTDNINGQNIYTTTIGNDHTFTSGTSFAAPLVSGLASLLKGYSSTLTNDDIRQIIRLTADDKGEPGFDPEYGYGRINAGNALHLIQEPNEVVHGISYGGSTTKTNLNRWIYTGSSWNLAAGMYFDVDRYTVTKRVNFDVPFCSPPPSCG